MWRYLRCLLAVIVLGAVGGALVALSGIVHVGASTGHWLITDWVLHGSMRRSVYTHSMGIETPPLDDPALVERGAGHYASQCMACHGAPGIEQSVLARSMTPPPPRLQETVGEWELHHLFWITQHGIKLTAMPAWPTLERPDEVWAMVAFLLELPQMGAERYLQLAYGPSPRPGERGIISDGPDSLHPEPREAALPPATQEPIQGLVQACDRCHAREDETFADNAFPPLWGQSEAYLYATLRAFKYRHRQSGFMQAVAAEYTDEELRMLASHYARSGPPEDQSEPAAASDQRATSEKIEAGALIAAEGIANRGIPACSACHGPRPTRQPEAYPRLAPFSADYVETQLRLLREGKRGGTSFSPIMTLIASQLSDNDIAAVAAYYGSLGGQR